MYPDLESKMLNFSFGLSSLSVEVSLSESSLDESLPEVLLPSVSFFFFSSFFFAFSAYAS